MEHPRHATQDDSLAFKLMPLLGTTTAFVLLVGIGAILGTAATMMM